MGWTDMFWRRTAPVLPPPTLSAPEPAAPIPHPGPYTERHLSAAGASPELIARFLAPLNAAALEFEIVYRRRPWMFLAQVAHESGRFRYTSELWGPTPAQLKYEGRPDLGNSAIGDGPLFRGHGLIQITGRANHQAVAQHFRLSFPRGVIEWLQSPDGACRSAAWFWSTHGCNELADAGDFVAVTRRINGGLNGLEDRQSLYGAICEAAGVAP